MVGLGPWLTLLRSVIDARQLKAASQLLDLAKAWNYEGLELIRIPETLSPKRKKDPNHGPPNNEPITTLGNLENSWEVQFSIFLV